MFDLFRFMMLRPPEKVDASTTISLSGETTLVAALRDASQGKTPLLIMQRVAQTYELSDDFVGNLSSLVHSNQYILVDEFLRQTSQTLDAVATYVSKVFKNPVKTVMTEKGFLLDKQRIQDSLIALQLATPPPNAEPEQLVKFCRMIDLIERVGREDPSLKHGEVLQSLHRMIVLPADLFPLSSVLVRQSPPTYELKATAAQARQDQLDRAAALKETIRAVNALPLAAQIPVSKPQPTFTAPSAPGTLNLVTSPRSLPNIGPLGISNVDPRALQALSPSVKSVLSGLNLDLSLNPISAVVDRLNTELMNTMDLAFSGGGVAVGQPPSDPFHEPPTPQEWWDGPPPVLSGPPSTFNSQVTPAGIADLLVVREHVVRYEPGEIAFVENVARGELLKRQTHRKDTTESSTLTTTSMATETQRDLQATSRFDLQNQSQSVIEQDTQRVPGVGSTDAYGPLVDSGGSNKQSATRASNYGQDVTRRAVSKITESLQTQVLQRATSEFAENIEHDFDNSKEKTDEIVVYQWLDRISEAEVFSYDKRVVYDFIVPEPAAFLVNALRNWQPALTQLQKPTLFALPPQKLDRNNYQDYSVGYGATGIQPPPEERITIAKEYGNDHVPLSAIDDPGSTEARTAFEKELITIKEGYQAVSVNVNASVGFQAPNFSVVINIGRLYWHVDAASATLPNFVMLDNEVGEIPLVIYIFNSRAYSIALEIVCQPTAENFAEWQTTTHDAILQASRDRIAEYEDKLNNLKAALQVQVAGKTSDQKRALLQAELEKSCISILSNQHFDGLNAIEFSSFDADAVPQLFLPNVDPVGRYIRFFQQAFEWDQMMYRYYPYFWGRKKYWNDRLQIDDQDPEFAAFLNAGAARVTIAVRKGYENAVAAFLNNGTYQAVPGVPQPAPGSIPSQNDLLGITTGLYVPFFAEMNGADAGPDTATPYGNPPVRWEVRVPTKLVKIRTDNTLPKWKQSTDSTGQVTYVPIAGDSVNP